MYLLSKLISTGVSTGQFQKLFFFHQKPRDYNFHTEIAIAKLIENSVVLHNFIPISKKM